MTKDLGAVAILASVAAAFFIYVAVHAPGEADDFERRLEFVRRMSEAQNYQAEYEVRSVILSNEHISTVTHARSGAHRFRKTTSYSNGQESISIGVAEDESYYCESSPGTDSYCVRSEPLLLGDAPPFGDRGVFARPDLRASDLDTLPERLDGFESSLGQFDFELPRKSHRTESREILGETATCYISTGDDSLTEHCYSRDWIPLYFHDESEAFDQIMIWEERALRVRRGDVDLDTSLPYPIVADP